MSDGFFVILTIIFCSSCIHLLGIIVHFVVSLDFIVDILFLLIMIYSTCFLSWILNQSRKIVKKKILIHLLFEQISGKQNDSNLRTRGPEVPEPDTSLSLSSLVGDDSPIHNVLPTSSCLKLVTSKPKCKSSLLTGRSFCASANQSLSISTKKLCNISASYLLDISPEGVRCPLTPEEYTGNIDDILLF